MDLLISGVNHDQDGRPGNFVAIAPFFLLGRERNGEVSGWERADLGREKHHRRKLTHHRSTHIVYRHLYVGYRALNARRLPSCSDCKRADFAQLDVHASFGLSVPGKADLVPLLPPIG
ncbi:hypothetical protein FJW08_21380 [Mesorhizobium sp. B3-2-1]|uniref:hypothetical protein n=1 Tax=Mesorhizobium sp. B3-2-1 TaxID=2589891 RepID=UPI00112C4587|nr:hypothetical protein [Mesorhizobium sp. B3-2-1]TPI28326.1 hypothetical protein FJW08_21380 [Mesorhizobium sp. B3-2-1]